jgi:toxin ParE1/3/4
MDFEVTWTEPAVADLEAILAFVARRSRTAAETLRLALLDHVEILGAFPLIGPVYGPDHSGQTREIVCRSYRIFYRVDTAAKRVEILTVWHGARDEPGLPD